MTHTFVVTDIASLDTKDVYEWYEAELTGLGNKFLDKLDATYIKLKRHPQIGKVVEDDIRSFAVPTYPYTIFYLINNRSIYILRVLHQHRHPDTWKR